MSISDWFPDWVSVLSTSYTYRTMLSGTAAVGTVTGLLGCVLYFRRQTLIADVVGHGAIGGIAVAFLIAAGILGIDGRSLPVIMLGAAVAGLLAMVLTSRIAATTPLGTDAAMAVMIALLFGGGMVLMRYITFSELTGRGGLEKALFGNAATLTSLDLKAVWVIAVVVVAAVVVFFRPLSVMLFDPKFALTQGLNSTVIHAVLTVSIIAGLVIGTKAIGVMLMIGFVMLPPAAARQWANSAKTMLLLSACFGALGGVGGSLAAVWIGEIPTGPVSILLLFVLFSFSLVFGRRSWLVNLWHRRLKHRQSGLTLPTHKEVPQ